ncbi:hypothetical protein LOD99_4772 [Oopsacas minuta]|uniref:Transposase n=1 Tax=Oopsacas minuta TaxID=111878 RepID=A0AAV7JT13_9METZ|nr:hypothetical protein LOD99_4772 [Oopsacas minuta]
MATVFWDKEGIIHLDWLSEKTTINSDYYVDKLKELRQVIKRERRGKLTSGVLLQHDNAKPHVSSKIMAAIDDLGFECLPHSPYSPGLAPSDDLLFGEMKRPVRGRDLRISIGWSMKYNSGKKGSLKNTIPLG